LALLVSQQVLDLPAIALAQARQVEPLNPEPVNAYFKETIRIYSEDLTKA
jgi:hypothetical protein